MKKNINFLLIIFVMLIFTSCSKTVETKEISNIESTLPDITSNNTNETVTEPSTTTTETSTENPTPIETPKEVLQQTNDNIQEKTVATKEQTKVQQKTNTSTTNNIEETKPTTEDKEVKNVAKTVSLSVSGPDNVILQKETVEITEGDTVYSVLEKSLKSHNISLSARGTSNNKYIEGINDIYEFDFGPSSGFIYKVNGTAPEYSSSKYTLKGGETIEWIYKK